MAFNRRKSSNSEGSSKRARSGGRSSEGRSSGGRSGRSKGGSDYKFAYIGNVSVSKKTQESYDKEGTDVVEMLQDSEISLGIYVTQDMELQKGDSLILFLQPPGEKDKDWIVGKLVMPNEQ